MPGEQDSYTYAVLLCNPASPDSPLGADVHGAVWMFHRETLEEIAMENHPTFLEAGAEMYRYIPCLPGDLAHVTMSAVRVTENL